MTAVIPYPQAIFSQDTAMDCESTLLTPTSTKPRFPGKENLKPKSMEGHISRETSFPAVRRISTVTKSMKRWNKAEAEKTLGSERTTTTRQQHPSLIVDLKATKSTNASISSSSSYQSEETQEFMLPVNAYTDPRRHSFLSLYGGTAPLRKSFGRRDSTRRISLQTTKQGASGPERAPTKRIHSLMRWSRMRVLSEHVDSLSTSNKVEEGHTLARTIARINSNGNRDLTFEEANIHSGDLSCNDVLTQLRVLPNAERVKYFAFASYGKGDWSLDILSLVHNAIRHECSQLSMLLTRCLDHQQEYATQRDAQTLHKWWKQFYVFVLTMFEMEEMLLYPVLERRTTLPVQLQEEQRQHPRRKIIRALRSVGRSFNSLLIDPIQNVLEMAVKAHSDFSYRILKHLYNMERVLPSIIHDVLTKQEVSILTRQQIDFIRQHPNTQENLVLLSRWMDGELLDIWKQTYLSRTSRVTYKISRLSIDKQEARISNTIFS